MKTILLHLAISFLCSTPSLGLEWAEDDAIYIEDGSLLRTIPDKNEKEVTNENFSSENNTNPNATEKSQQPLSIPVEIIPGQCIKFNDCYPIFFHPKETGQEPQVTNFNLYEFVLRLSDVCEPSDLPAERSLIENIGEVYIWCPQRIFPPRPPTVSVSTIKIKSDEEGDDENDEVACGPVKTASDASEESLQTRVVEGEEVALGSHPWMVALMDNRNKGKAVCGGSLLDATHVLLAAHCVSHLRQRHLSSLKVLIGDHDLKDPTDIEHQERNVSAVIYHKDFSVRTIHSDIALLVLSEPVQFADNVAPICLSDGTPAFDEGDETGTIAGWGQTGEYAPPSNKLLKTDLPIWKQEECVEIYKGKGPIGVGVTSDMFCAGGSADACKGDSGSPLWIVRDNRTEQLGIVSWGIGCGRYPGVFVRVPKYLEWIEKHRSQKYIVK